MTFSADWNLIGDKLYRSGSIVPETESQVLFVFKDGREIPLMLIDIPTAIKFDDRLFVRTANDRTPYFVYQELDMIDVNTISSTVIRAELQADSLARMAVMRGDVPLPKTPSKIAQFLENNPEGVDEIKIDRRLLGFENNEQKQ